MSEQVTARITAILVFGDGQAANGSVEGFRPPAPDHFGASVQFLISDATRDDRQDSFDITVCTPGWLAEALAGPDWSRFNRGLRVIPDGVLPGASIWLMRRWDPSLLTAAASAICEAFSPGPDFGTVAARIGRLIPWEFDYRYDDEMNKRG